MRSATVAAPEVDTLAPRIFTPPLGPLTPDTTYGYEAIATAERVLGFPLMPWQRWVLLHALEHRDGRFLRATVVILVGRQNGKTTLQLIRALWGMLTGTDKSVVSMAQRMEVAHETWQQGIALLQDRIPREIGRVRLSNGQESLTLRNGARWRTVAANARAARGMSGVDLVVMDELREQRSWEVWASSDKVRSARPNAQLWAASNAGDRGSLVLNHLRDIGRASVDRPDSTLGWYEYSAPEGCALDDAEGIRYANPAHGITILPGTVARELTTDPPAVFRTERLCQWVDTISAAIDPASVAACTDPGTVAAPGPWWLAVDSDPEGRSVALVAAGWAEGHGRLAVRCTGLLEPATASLAVAAVERTIAARGSPPVSIGIDPATSASIRDRLASLGHPITEFTTARHVQALADLTECVRDRILAHDGDTVILDHLANAARAPAGDGGYRLTRKGSDLPIPGAVALAECVHLATRPEDAPEPEPEEPEIF